VTATVVQERTRSAPLAVWAVAVLLPVGPLAIAVLRLALPYYTSPKTADVVAAAHAHPGRESAVIWLGYVGVLLLVPGIILTARVCRDQAPRLTAWALALAVPGYLSMGMMLGYDHVVWSATHAHLSAADAAAVVDAAHPSLDVSIGVFVLGHVVGTVLLGLALLRSGRIPAWAAWAIAVSQPIHFIATVILGSPQVDFVAWCLTALGLALVARVVVAEEAAGRRTGG
jgi:hypothetical protein